jgi:hypothetical protein
VDKGVPHIFFKSGSLKRHPVPADLAELQDQRAEAVAGMW